MPVIGRSQRRVGANSETELDGDASAPTSVRIAGPLSARSDFEKFAEDAAGYTLQVYGRQLFNEVPSTFAPVDRIPVPANYALGPGDELLIRTWGKIELNARVTVDRNGQISLPRVGTLNVLGLRYEQLEGYLRTAIGSIYKDFELNVTLGQLRSIQIFVLGSARRPGAYTVSSLSTLVNALFASGGPSATGTMRNIQLRRGDRLLTEFDIYDLLRKGDKSHDVQLLPGDIIYIPTIGPQVAIVESVNEPGIYELNGETTIASALANAGGLTSLAGVDRVLLERIENHRRRRVDEFTLDASGLQRLLKDGDLLRIFPLSPMFENAVTLRGNVAQPGRYVWHQGMRISNLIPSREFLMTRGHWNQQNQLVAENIDRQFGNSQMAMNSHPDMMTGIAQANAEINWDYAAIERLDEHDLSTRLIAFNLATAIDNPTSLDNQMLEPGDILTIFSRKDLPLPLEKHASFVQVGGEVNTPGVYRIVPGETLRTLVGRAGGLTPHSYLFASQLTRVSTRLIQEEQLRLSISRIQKDLASQYANTPRNAENPSSGQNSANQLAQLNMQRTLVDQLSTTQPNGRVVLGIKPGGMTIADIPDFPLEDGDSLFIPPKLGTVQVTGEVYNANALRYQLRKPLSAYLEDSGGPTRLADVKRIFLIRADGTVVSRQSRQLWQRNFDQMVLMPGDAIIVPPKLKTPGGFMEELPLITQIISQTAMTGAVLSLIH
jgi:protein involved in polysaccharide export with SLBB domain